MKKLILAFILPLLFIGCSSDDSGDDVGGQTNKSSVKFSKNHISLKYGEASLIDIDKSIKDCNFSIKNDYYASISINGSEAKLNALKVGKTKIYVTYNDAKDSCIVNIEPKTFYLGDPLLDMGITRDSVRTYMKEYQQLGSVGGYTGESYSFNTNSKIYYQFDNSNKLVAIKQELKKSKYTLSDIQLSLNERFNPISNSSAVYWYSAPSIMTVRLENTVSTIIIHYAKDAEIMFNYFPW